MSLVTDPDVGAAFGAGMTYYRSTDGGFTWEPAIRLITDRSSPMARGCGVPGSE